VFHFISLTGEKAVEVLLLLTLPPQLLHLGRELLLLEALLVALAGFQLSGYASNLLRQLGVAVLGARDLKLYGL
jgi:uncharacterized membrane protein YvlD (DUF360 family)